MITQITDHRAQSTEGGLLLKILKRYVGIVPLILIFLEGSAFAAEAGAIDSGDTAWLLVSTALVMLMTPGLALFYGGMVRSKNVLGTIMQSFIMLGVVSIVWVLWGYTLAFGPDVNGLIGDLSFLGLRNVGAQPGPMVPTVPHLIFMMFQGMFAIITPALITGAFAERMKFSALLIFTILWVTFVYAPLAHWIWGGGWMASKLGVLDFAGGLVVHLNSAVAALAAVAVIGRRRGFGQEPMPPHNLPMTALGTGLLWFGWFGFNAGSALTSGGLASVAFVTTNTAAATSAFTWMLIEWITGGKPTALGTLTGAIAGLATITPAAGFVSPMASILIGIMAGIVCFIAVNLKTKLKFDDSLDVIGVHGVGGLIGVLATGLFASKAINPAGADGAFLGNPSLLGSQAIASLFTFGFVFVVSIFILKIIDWSIGLRVSEEAEFTGLDLSIHGERGYEFSVSGISGPLPVFRAHREESRGEYLEKRHEAEIRPSKRIPPKPAHTTSGHNVVFTQKKTDSPSTVSVSEGGFAMEVKGIDPDGLSRWWRSLCEMDWRQKPQAFKEIYGYVSRFVNGVFTFKGGSPLEFKSKLEELLSQSGFTDYEVNLLS